MQHRDRHQANHVERRAVSAQDRRDALEGQSANDTLSGIDAGDCGKHTPERQLMNRPLIDRNVRHQNCIRIDAPMRRP
jgi:hypothetical protein